MLKIILTLDYEIHGNGDGSPDALMVEPTRRMLDQFDRYGAKLTIMADVAEILKFREYHEQTGRDDFHYEAIAGQLRDAVRRGHDVQLHVHASYLKARCEQGRWIQDWSEYSFADLPPTRVAEILKLGKDYLESLLRPVQADYRCDVFRAANWSMCPSKNAVRALLAEGFRIDTSVFKYGRRDGLVHFDYSNAYSELEPWRIDESDVCRRDDSGRLWEAPIYCERRGIAAFLSVNRFYRALQSRAHRFTQAYGQPEGGNAPAGPRPSALRRVLGLLFSRHAWKADFNQCTGRQLIRALRRAEKAHPSPAPGLPFVLIGHSKLYTRFNESSLEPFLTHVASRPDRFAFGVFADLPLQTGPV